MAALTADVHIPHLGTPTKLKVKAIGADTFFAGALVYADSANGKAQVVPATGDAFLGICAAQVVAAAADDLVEIYIDGCHAIAFTGAAEADVGNVVVVDIGGGTLTDNEADLVSAVDATVAAADILIGKCVGLSQEEPTRGWVQLHLTSGIATAAGIGWGG